MKEGREAEVREFESWQRASVPVSDQRMRTRAQAAAFWASLPREDLRRAEHGLVRSAASLEMWRGVVLGVMVCLLLALIFARR